MRRRCQLLTCAKLLCVVIAGRLDACRVVLDGQLYIHESRAHTHPMICTDRYCDVGELSRSKCEIPASRTSTLLRPLNVSQSVSDCGRVLSVTVLIVTVKPCHWFSERQAKSCVCQSCCPSMIACRVRYVLTVNVPVGDQRQEWTVRLCALCWRLVCRRGRARTR